MPVILLAALLSACTRPTLPDPQQPDIVPPTPGSDTAAETWTSIPPSARVLGFPGMAMTGGVSPFAGKDGEPGGLVLTSIADQSSILISGAIEPGVHEVLDLWDGVSTFHGSIGDDTVLAAGDVNDDGHLDFWLNNDLYLGPLLGRALRAGEGQAWLESEQPVAAGFDSDGDGHEDLATYPGNQTAVVYHGPFTGKIPTLTEGAADPEQFTMFGSNYGSSSREVVWMFPDHLGPGRHAIGVGASALGVPDTFFYELNQPRGARVAFEEAFATYNEVGSSNPLHPFYDAGDINGDGMPDVVHHLELVHEGPLEGDFYPDFGSATVAVEIPAGLPHYPIGDLNGDGIQEILGSTNDGWIVIAFSPHAPVLDFSQGLPLGYSLEFSPYKIGERHADIDGDGLEDLVDDYNDPADEGLYKGQARIWYGKDLLAAWEALQAAR